MFGGWAKPGREGWRAPPVTRGPLPPSPPAPSPGHDKAASAATVPCEAHGERGAQTSLSGFGSAAQHPVAALQPPPRPPSQREWGAKSGGRRVWPRSSRNRPWTGRAGSDTRRYRLREAGRNPALAAKRPGPAAARAQRAAAQGAGGGACPRLPRGGRVSARHEGRKQSGASRAACPPARNLSRRRPLQPLRHGASRCAPHEAHREAPLDIFFALLSGQDRGHGRVAGFRSVGTGITCDRGPPRTTRSCGTAPPRPRAPSVRPRRGSSRPHR